MLNNQFLAAMTSEEFLKGEALHCESEPSRELAMAAGLTKSSQELEKAWKKNPELFLTTLSGAIAAYENNKNIEELLIGCISRLISVVDEESDVVSIGLEIVKNSLNSKSN
jgi:hypothetical protein